MGQRPAGHECRMGGHEVDAGSRNPGADAVSGFQKPCQLHKCGNLSLANPSQCKKGANVETKQPQTSPAQTRENIMGTMEINPLLVKLSVPMMISMLVQALYNVVDSVFVSHVSESALTAVSLAFSLQNVMIAVGVGTGVGVNAMLSKSLGEKNQSRANATAKNGIFLSLCSFVVFLVIGLKIGRAHV